MNQSQSLYFSAPDTSGTAYQGTDKAGLKTDFVPQLLNPIASELDVMQYIGNPEWIMQEKMDGERRAVDGNLAGEVIGMNRKGLAIPLPEAIVAEVTSLAKAGDIRLDGEQIGDKLYVFDLLMYEGIQLRKSMVFMERMRLAESILSGCQYLVPVPMVVTAEKKSDLYMQIKMQKGEGVVFKRRDSMSSDGRPNSGGDWLKFKFVERASCVVTGINDGKRSVAIGLLPADAMVDMKQDIIAVGNVAIPPSAPIPKVGAIIEVQYLYAYEGGSLFQPVYVTERADINFDDCTLSQLKYKPVNSQADKPELEAVN